MNFSGPPEFYSDSVKMGFSPYGFLFEFGLMTTSPNDAKSVALIRMSPQHAFVYYQFLKKQLREYEAQVGKIALPSTLLGDLQLEEDI